MDLRAKLLSFGTSVLFWTLADIINVRRHAARVVRNIGITAHTWICTHYNGPQTACTNFSNEGKQRGVWRRVNLVQIAEKPSQNDVRFAVEKRRALAIHTHTGSRREKKDGREAWPCGNEAIRISGLEKARLGDTRAHWLRTEIVLKDRVQKGMTMCKGYHRKKVAHGLNGEKWRKRVRTIVRESKSTSVLDRSIETSMTKQSDRSTVMSSDRSISTGDLVQICWIRIKSCAANCRQWDLSTLWFHCWETFIKRNERCLT